MRIVTTLLALLLAACTPAEPETHTATADVDLASIPSMLAAIDGLADNDLPVDDLLALTNSVPMDDEKQQRFAVTFGGEETEILYHVWREQEGWVHVYASSTSRDLIAAVERSIKAFQRSQE